MNAQDVIIKIIRNKVAVMNVLASQDYPDTEALERFRHELTGMMICLKNINSTNDFYCINYWENSYEFGYYDEGGAWFSIEGRRETA